MVLKEIKNNRTRENKTAVKLGKNWYKEENKILQVNEGIHRKYQKQARDKVTYK